MNEYFRARLPKYCRLLLLLTVLMIVRHFYLGNVEPLKHLGIRIGVIGILFSAVYWFYTFVTWFESDKEHVE